MNIQNPNDKWIDTAIVRIGKCTKCKGLRRAAMYHAEQKSFRDSCSTCNDFKTFKVINPLTK